MVEYILQHWYIIALYGERNVLLEFAPLDRGEDLEGIVLDVVFKGYSFGCIGLQCCKRFYCMQVYGRG